MTETMERTAIDQALSVIDAELARLASREVVTGTEATNVLLDLRLLLAPQPSPATGPF